MDLADGRHPPRDASPPRTGGPALLRRAGPHPCSAYASESAGRSARGRSTPGSAANISGSVISGLGLQAAEVRRDVRRVLTPVHRGFSRQSRKRWPASMARRPSSSPPGSPIQTAGRAAPSVGGRGRRQAERRRELDGMVGGRNRVGRAVADQGGRRSPSRERGRGRRSGPRPQAFADGLELQLPVRLARPTGGLARVRSSRVPLRARRPAARCRCERILERGDRNGSYCPAWRSAASEADRVTMARSGSSSAISASARSYADERNRRVEAERSITRESEEARRGRPNRRPRAARRRWPRQAQGRVV